MYLFQVIIGLNEQMECGKLCKLRAAINERVILCRLTKLDQKVEDIHDGGAQTRDSLQSNS